MNWFLTIAILLFVSPIAWGKPCSSPKTYPKPKYQSRGGYPGYLLVSGPVPIFEDLPPVDFNRLMLTPIPSGIQAKEEANQITTKQEETSLKDKDSRKAVKRSEDRVISVESSAGGEYYRPHHRVNVDTYEDEPEILPEDLLFFYEQGGKGAHGNKNYYIPFNLSPGDLAPQTQPVPSKATYRRER